jgi:hypothetical protein
MKCSFSLIQFSIIHNDSSNIDYLESIHGLEIKIKDNLRKNEFNFDGFMRVVGNKALNGTQAWKRYKGDDKC